MSCFTVRDYAGSCTKGLVETQKKKIRNGNLPNTSPNEVITTLTNLLGKSDYYLRVSVLF